jgi:hypothetical protein
MELPISRPTDTLDTTTLRQRHEPAVPHPEIPDHGFPGVEDLEVAVAFELQVDPVARLDVLVRHGGYEDALAWAATRSGWRPGRRAVSVLTEQTGAAAVAAARIGDHVTAGRLMSRWRDAGIARRRWAEVGEAVTDELMAWVYQAAESNDLVLAANLLAVMPPLDSTAARRHEAWVAIRQPLSHEMRLEAYRREGEWVSILAAGDSPDLSTPTGAAQGVRESGAYRRLLDRLDAVPGLRVVEVPWDLRAHRFALVEVER